MFKTIVLGLDGSEGSRRAIPVATELAQRDNANLVLATSSNGSRPRAASRISTPTSTRSRPS
jgi:nucleotide-binding universal stress UspA family protein